jgi:uncharacterized UPF0160 family protein
VLAVTHNGPFHADDVLAAAMLLEIHGDVEIIRTRDKDVIKEADIVFDVGGVYDPDTRRYDHHQLVGAGDRLVNDILVPYSSAGLVWLCEYRGSDSAFDYVEERLVAGVDAQDNGIALCDNEIRPMDFSALVSQFNPDWDDEDQDFDYHFFLAVDFARSVLQKMIASAGRQVKAAALVEDALRHRTQPEIVVLEKFCPWQKTLAEYPEVLYVVFPDSASSTWRVQCVPVEPGGFESRRPLPETWYGLNGTDLDAAMGVDGVVFCHRNGFIARHETRKGALAMAQAALP